MPLFRVNARETRVVTRITQYEIEADDAEKAAIFVSMGIFKREIFDPEDTGVISTDIQRGDPTTYAVVPAEPLIAMEKASMDHWKKIARQQGAQRLVGHSDIDD